MTTAVVVYENSEQVRKDLERIRDQVAEVLPSKVDAERFLRVITKAVIESPKLMQCTRLSLLASVHEAAQLGLEPSGLLGSAYLVPYRMRREVNGKWQSVHEAKLIVGYRGLIDLARRSGEVTAIQAELVRDRDEFDYQPPRRPDPIIHRPFIPRPSESVEDRDRGPVVGAYMLAWLRGGDVHPEWMTFDEIEANRKRSKAADDGPWITDWPQMARKTVVRRGSNYLPLTTEFRRALELESEAEQTAERPEAVRPVTRAASILVERARSRDTAPGSSETAAVPDTGGDSHPGEDADVEPCLEMTPDGECILVMGHEGPHAS